MARVRRAFKTIDWWTSQASKTWKPGTVWISGDQTIQPDGSFHKGNKNLGQTDNLHITQLAGNWVLSDKALGLSGRFLYYLFSPVGLVRWLQPDTCRALRPELGPEGRPVPCATGETIPVRKLQIVPISKAFLRSFKDFSGSSFEATVVFFHLCYSMALPCELCSRETPPRSA